MLPYQKSNQGSTAPPLLKPLVEGTPAGSTENLSNFPKPFSVWENSKRKIRNLRDTFEERLRDTELRRKKRYYDINTEEERLKKNLESDEFFVPVRKVDTNIRREQTKYIPYLTQSSRDVVIKNPQDSSMDCAILEEDFTSRARYDDWLTPILEWVDSSQTHALGFCEILFDINYPGHFLIESIEYENLLFPLDVKSNIQNCSYLIRIVEYTKEELVLLVQEKGFKPAEVDKILGKNPQNNENNTEEESLICVEKVFFRENGQIMVGWSCVETCDDWIKDPEPLFNGRVSVSVTQVPDPLTGMPVPRQDIKQEIETDYPIFLLPYIVSENKKLLSLKGRVFLDELVQEAATALTSSAITAYKRASGLYFSSTDPTGTTIEEAQTEIRLKQGAIFASSLQSFALAYPDPSIFNAINAMLSQNDQETATINFASLNRKDSRKTATEVEAGQQEGQLMGIVQVVLFSIAYGKLRKVCFSIYRSRVLAGLIKADEQVSLMLSLPVDFLVKPAGDSDFIERIKKVQTMLQVWPIYQATPAAGIFLENLTKLLFPDEASVYIQAMRQGDVKNALLLSAKDIFGGLIEQFAQNPTPENTQKIVQLTQLNNTIDKVVSPQVEPGQETQEQPKEIANG